MKVFKQYAWRISASPKVFEYKLNLSPNLNLWVIVLELPPYLRFNYDRAVDVITSFIRSVVREAGVDGVVIGLSGGSDSALVATLAVRALGKSKVKVVHLPEKESSSESFRLSRVTADFLGVELHVIDITNAVESFLKMLNLSYENAPKVVKGNIKVRSRMLLLYAIANLENRLVLGTSDRSEWLIGYFTKWGDGAADAYPIIGLYKTQVRALGLYLGIPREVILRPSTPDLWPGHTAEGELGITYEEIDRVLYWIFDEGIPPSKVSEVSKVPKEVVERVLELHKKSEHKRSPLKAPFRSFKELK